MRHIEANSGNIPEHSGNTSFGIARGEAQFPVRGVVASHRAAPEPSGQPRQVVSSTNAENVTSSPVYVRSSASGPDSRSDNATDLPVAPQEVSDANPSDKDAAYRKAYEQELADIARRKELVEQGLPRQITEAARAIDTFVEKQGREPTYQERLQITGNVTLSQAVIKKYEFMGEVARPSSDEDAEYRDRIEKEFPKAIKDATPEGLPLRFHAAPLYASREIIHIQAISSSVDRIGVATSYDGAGYFSVTTPDSVRESTGKGGYINLRNENECLPLGCVFVMTPSTPEDAYGGLSMTMRNVDFDEQPERLVKVLTSPESLPRVQEWLTHAGVAPDKATEFFAYTEELQALKEQIERGEVDIQDLVSYPLSSK